MFGKNLQRLLVPAILLSTLVALPVMAQKSKSKSKAKVPKPVGTPVIWRDPGSISNLNLTFGPGSPELAPVGPFTFLKEEVTGESAKFDVTDARGTVWV